MPRVDEVAAGLKVPSIEWRQEYLAAARPRAAALRGGAASLVDGTVLSAHQVDALSGTLTALLADVQRSATATATTSASKRRDSPTEDDGSRRDRRVERRGRRRRTRRRARGGRREDRRRGRGRGGRGRRGGRAPSSTRSRRTGRTTMSVDRTSRGAAARRGSRRAQALLVRARDRRRQDRRGARLRRGLPHRRGADPHPSPQPRRPVHRRAARPRLPRSHSASRCSTATTPPTGRSRSRPTSGSCATSASISDAYTIVICDEAHTALGEKTSAASARGPGRSWSA